MRFLFLVQDGYPVVRVGLVAILDCAQLVVELGAHGAGLAVFGDDIRFLVFEVVDALMRAIDSSSASAAGEIRAARSSSESALPLFTTAATVDAGQFREYSASACKSCERNSSRNVAFMAIRPKSP